MPIREQHIPFPLAGLHEGVALQAQPPHTTPYCYNVRPLEVFEERRRGGTRPGLDRAYAKQFTAGIDGLCVVSVMEDETLRDALLVLAGGTVWIEETDGTFTDLSLSPLLTEDGEVILTEDGASLYVETTSLVDDGEPIATAEYYQRVFIADRGAALLADVAVTIDEDERTLVRDDGLPWPAFDRLRYAVRLHDATDPLVTGSYRVLQTEGAELLVEWSVGGSGAAQASIEVAPKWIDLRTRQWRLWVADEGKGQVPLNARLLCQWRGRLILAHTPAEPHAIYASRVNDPWDWDYAETDVLTAWAMPTGGSGDLGQPVRALMPATEDTLLIGCTQSLWAQSGDPTAGGTLRTLSRSLGVVGGTAWCNGLGGDVFVIGDDGLYRINADPRQGPENLSRQALPQALRSLDATELCVTLAYDPLAQGVHTFAVPWSTAPGAPTAQRYWFEAAQSSWWPVVFRAALDPVAMVRHTLDGQPVVLLGCRDGYIRHFDTAHDEDDGYAIPAMVTLGPFALGDGASEEGVLLELRGALAADSHTVWWGVRGGNTPEAALSGSINRYGFWTAGLNYTVQPRLRANCYIVRLTTDYAGLTEPWAMEYVTVRMREAGRVRKL